jgi:AcrR family transcriptional regulator
MDRATPLPSVSYAPRGADATREKLLQATHELLIERAGAEPSLSQICERAGVQTGMVRYCFGSKSQMLEALVERLRDGVRADLARLAAIDLAPEEKLRRNVRAMVRNFVRYPYGTQLSEQLRAGRDHGEQIATVFGDAMVPFYTELLDEGAGAFRELDPRLLFVSVAGMAEYFSAARSLFAADGAADDDGQLIDRFCDHTIELLLNGIRARSTGATPDQA